jgi:hypothetical protein
MTWTTERVAVLGLALMLSGCAAETGASDPASTPTATETPSASPSVRIESPRANPLPVYGPIDPGTYFVPRGPYAVVRFTFTMPAGWISQNIARTFSKHPDEPNEVGFGPFVLTQIYSDACRGDGVLIDVGPTVDELADALLAQPGPAASGPVDIMLGGYPGKRIDMTVPADLDLATCRMDGLQIWLDAATGKYQVLAGNGALSVFIVDVNGERLVITTQYRVDASSAEDIAEMAAIIQSIRIEP